jgi:hemerythrin superfamily protein
MQEPGSASPVVLAPGALRQNPGETIMATKKEMDAVALLKADHRKVEDLFEKFESARGNKQKIAQQICMELIIHAQIEEEIFYPACTGEVEDENLVQEAYVEHDSAKVLIAEILAGGPDDEFYDAKVKVLSEMIKHHVKEEEKRAEGLFAEAKEAGLDMDALGGQLMARKEELMQEYKSGLPTPQTRSFKGTELDHGEPVSQAA